MKKLTMLFAGMLFAGFSFGQNTATTTITGNNNDSDIKQLGDHQSAVVVQDGNQNKSDVDQDNTADAPSIIAGQEADVYQQGNWNDAKIDMKMKKGTASWAINEAEVDQIGNHNASTQLFTIDYNNKNNHAEATQIGNGNTQLQIIGGGHVQTLKLTQTGDNNKSDQRTEGGAGNNHDNTAVVEQTGNSNDAKQRLDGFALGKDTNPGAGAVTIDQEGNNNKGTQDFRTKRSNGKIYQTGNWNESRQYILSGEMNMTNADMVGNSNYTMQHINGVYNTSEIYIDGSSNDVRTVQNGDYNTSDIQLNWSNNGDASNNDVDVDQIGDDNNFELKIKRGDIGGDWNVVDVMQDGIDNNHRLEIDGSSNQVDIYAEGNGNQGKWEIVNHGSWSETSDHNVFKLEQKGDLNIATGIIEGDNNDVDICQTGSANYVGSHYNSLDGVIILGNHNTVDVKQFNTGNSASVSITGNWNTSSTTQN